VKSEKLILLQKKLTNLFVMFMPDKDGIYNFTYSYF